MNSQVLAINPEELQNFIVNQTINHGIEVDKLKKEVKENALEFGKWVLVEENLGFA